MEMWRNGIAAGCYPVLTRKSSPSSNLGVSAKDYMLKVAYFGSTDEVALASKVNEFLRQNLRIINVVPFGTRTYCHCQVLYEEGETGSKLAKASALYTEPDTLEIPRME